MKMVFATAEYSRAGSETQRLQVQVPTDTLQHLQNSVMELQRQVNELLTEQVEKDKLQQTPQNDKMDAEQKAHK